MGRILRVLRQTICLRCPACEHGRMFRSLFTMNVRCPVCGVIFERDAGEVTGGMAINMTVTMALAFVGASLAYFSDVPVWQLLTLLIVLSTLFALWFYRRARALWTGILYLTGSMFED
ncbi:MAG TPA: DUF983 domain-containing protein [Roseiflexaceae bacterium]|nr:DUF983 domain-containing protein [Roseiflexaceae bacterium]